MEIQRTASLLHPRGRGAAKVTHPYYAEKMSAYEDHFAIGHQPAPSPDDRDAWARQTRYPPELNIVREIVWTINQLLTFRP